MYVLIKVIVDSQIFSMTFKKSNLRGSNYVHDENSPGILNNTSL